MTDAFHGRELQEKLESREATVGVIGLGYVGLPLSLAFAEAGFDVHGFDIDDGRVGRLRNGDSYVDDIDDARLEAALESGFTPSADPNNVADCDAYVIAVPTGMVDGEPDMAAIQAAAETVAEQSADRETLVVVSSTVYPGGTREVVSPIVRDEGGAIRHLAMVPERLNPGGDHELAEIPLVVGADEDSSRAAATNLFGAIVDETHPVDSMETAELTKTLENTYRMVNIALVNQLITLAEDLDADVWEAIDAAATKPFGFQPFRPGPGVGGHCIPIDPQFLTWRAEDLGTELPFLENAHRVNERMPTLTADRLETLLRARGVDIVTASVVALGASYKPNVGDTRNSPALRVIDNLPGTTDVTVVDPHVDADEIAREFVRAPEQAPVGEADIVVVLVDHDAFDLRAVGDEAGFVFDTRNAMPDEDVSADVVTLGELLDGAVKTPPSLIQ
jgi:UDP-N-acetyl-D-glucosamine dehydrogenase